VKKQKSARLVLAAFKYADSNAKAVFVAGSFNHWYPAVAPLQEIAPGCWETVLSLVQGDHEYLFIVDGKWVLDPFARDFCPNPYDGVNSLITAR
jgi:1,4-alpha-glucan branching enzyme